MEAFRKLDFRIGRILAVDLFPKARNPSYKVRVDFGPSLGIRMSSAQLTKGYPDPSTLVGQLTLAIINFPPRRIAGFSSEVLITGMYADDVRVFLVQPAQEVEVGSRVTLLDSVTGGLLDVGDKAAQGATIEDFHQCQFALTASKYLGLGGYDEHVLAVKNGEFNPIPLVTSEEIAVGTALK
ncbi:hypothetical protein HDU79_006064 [Rhizoclosmatium sp. JEL0117]|nr:hypothetical protein HDU79_006064 [Rhizoclosmatium sp. JEL0117]